MDAIELLVRQHRELEASMRRALAGLGGPSAGFLFTRFADGLALHVTSEEQVLHPAVRARAPQDILPASLEEHLSLKSLLADLLALEPAERTFGRRLAALTEQVAQHHHDEEQHLFPQVLGLIDPARRDALGMEMLALQRHLLRVGEPRSLVAQQTLVIAPLWSGSAAAQPARAP